MSTALRRIVATFAILALCLIPLSGSLGIAQAQDAPAVKTDTSLPLFENIGQLADSVDFHLQGTAHEILIANTEIKLATYGQNAASLGLAFSEASPSSIAGIRQWPNNVQFLFADDVAHPLGGVPAFSGVRYDNLHPGVRAIVEAVIDADDRFQLKRTLEVTDADTLKSIIFSYPGNQGLSIAEDGGLIVDVGLNPKLGQVKDALQVFYVDDDLQRELVEASFVLNGDGSAYVEAEGLDASRTLYVELSLDYTVMMEPYAEMLGEMTKMHMAPEREVPYTLPTRGMSPSPTLAAAVRRVSAAAPQPRGSLDKAPRADSKSALKALIVGHDFGGADLIVGTGDVLSGIFTNVGRFVVPSGVTAFVDHGVALYVYADEIDIEGSLEGVGRGYAGGIARDLRGAQGVTGGGPGGGARGMMGPVVHATGGGGGGHGGAGGAGMTLVLPLTAPGGDDYDFEPDAIQMGSGGGSGANHAIAGFGKGGTGGAGGASIYLEAETVTLDGSLVVDGNDGSQGSQGSSPLAVSGGGGGSGGGVLIRGAFTCSQSALISARGGIGADVVGSIGWGTGGGGGAGGRVKFVGAGNPADCNIVLEGGQAGTGTPGTFMPALPGGPGGIGAKNGDAMVADVALEDLAQDGEDGAVDAVASLNQPANLCSTTVFSFANLTPVTIFDNTLATSTIAVAGTGTFLADIDVTTNIVGHTFASDLDITVTSPAGTISTLTTDNGGGNANVFQGTIWDDDANPGSPASAQPQPPINGLATDHAYVNNVLASPLVAEEALGAFVGQNPTGVWTLSIFDDAAGDTGTFTWSVAVRTCLATPVFSTVNASNLVPTAILDNTTNQSTITIAGASTIIRDVNAVTNIVHTFASDLDFSITSPAGTSVTLSTDNGGGFDNVFNGTLWDDSADPGGPATLQTPNATSNIATDHTYTDLVLASPLVPEEAMAAFLGENPNGTWTLQIFDDAGGDTGTFTWSLAIQAINPAVPPTGIADLSMVKTTLPVGQATVIAGNNLTYRVTATNLGPDSTIGVVIEDTLPVNTFFISATPIPGAPDGSCTFTLATRLVRCTWTSIMVPFAARIVDITVRVCSGVLCNTVLQNRALVRDNNTQLGAQIYRQEFTTSQGDFVITNDAQPSANWIFANNCTSSTSNLGAGHTVPGTLRWGAPTTCANFGAAATNDLARTPLINTSACVANLTFNFRYYVNFQEAEPFDEAFVDVGIIVGGVLTRAAALPGAPGGVGQVSMINDFNTANANPIWQTATINVTNLLGTIPPNMLIQFRGNTLDGIGNAGQGYIIDDVTVNCDRSGDPNPNNNAAVLNTTVRTQSTFNVTKSADRREVPTGNEVAYTIVATNLGPSDSAGTVIRDTLPANFVFLGATTSRGACTAATPAGSTSTIVTCNIGVLGAPAALQCVTPALPNTVTVRIRARAATNLSEATVGCPEGLVDNFVAITSTNCETSLGVLNASAATCVVPKVDPNSQLGCQVHLPILNFQGADDVCTAWIEIQVLGCDPSKAVLVTWGEPGFCPPQAAGPLKVECTGLLVPGSSWIMSDSQIPTGSKSGIIFKFTAKQLSEVGLADDLGFDDVVADLMCEELFFGVVGDADDYRRFKKAYNEGGTFRGIPQDIAMGAGALAVEVLRKCPGDLTPGVDVTGKYNGIAGDHLGLFDNIFGGFSYYVPLVYADKAGLNSVMYIQNGGIECSSIEIWFKAQDDCLRARICDITTLAPGETYQYDATDCVGPDWQGSAWVRSSEPMGIAVDIVGRDILMTYVAEPAPFNYVFTIADDPELKLFRPGNRVLFGPLIYSEYQGWDTGIQVQNIDATLAAKVKVYFLDRSGDIITTLVDWICPRGSQTYFLPVVARLPGNWVGSVRVESQDWWTPGTRTVRAPSVVGVAQLIKYSDAIRTNTEQAIAYSLLPEHKAYNWQVGFADGGLDQGVGLIAIPSFLKDLDGSGVTTEVAIMNIAEKPGFTDFAIFIYDQNGLLDYVCQKLHDRQVEYIDLQTWGYVSAGFRGSAIISATFWEHDVFNPTGEFVRNLVGLGAVSVERTNTRLGEDVPGDEAAGDRGIPFRNDANLEMCFPENYVPKCPGQPVFP